MTDNNEFQENISSSEIVSNDIEDDSNSNNDKKKEKIKYPQNKPLKIIGIILSVIEIIVIAALGLTLYSFDLIPIKWLGFVLLIFLLFAVIIISNMLQPVKRKIGYVRKVLAIVFALCFIFGVGKLTIEVANVKNSLNNIPNSENIEINSESEADTTNSNSNFSVLFCSYDESILALELVNLSNKQVLSVNISSSMLESTSVVDRLAEIYNLLGVKTNYYLKIDFGDFDSLIEEIYEELNLEEVFENPEEMITTETVTNAIITVVFRHTDELISTASKSLSTNLPNEKLMLIAKSFVGGEDAFDTKNISIDDEESLENAKVIISKFIEGQVITDGDIQ